MAPTSAQVPVRQKENHMRKPSRLSFAALVALAGLVGVGSAAGQVWAQGDNGASELCPPLSTGKIDTPDPDPPTVSYAAPDGKLVVEVCAKAGTTTETRTFVAPGESSVVIRHSQGTVSHWSVLLVDAPSPQDAPVPPEDAPVPPDDAPSPEDALVPPDDAPSPGDAPVPLEDAPAMVIDGPATAPEPVDVDSAGPLPPAQTPDPTPAPPVAAPAAASLPATGSSSWALAGSALAALLAGTGLVRFSRRPDGSSTV